MLDGEGTTVGVAKTWPGFRMSIDSEDWIDGDGGTDSDMIAGASGKRRRLEGQGSLDSLLKNPMELQEWEGYSNCYLSLG